MLKVMLACALFAAGAAIGSFAALLADRLPRDETVVRGRSRCVTCNAVLGASAIVPLLSFAAQAGRCRSCGTAIPLWLPLAELLGGSVAVAAWVVAPTPGAAMAIALFGFALLALALLDWQALWLPDLITLPLATAGLAAVWVLPDPGLLARAGGAALGFAGFETIRLGYRLVRGREGLGAGDSKLLGAIGAWLGIAALPMVVFAAAMTGLAIVLLRIAMRRDADPNAPVPFGTALAGAAWVVLLARMAG